MRCWDAWLAVIIIIEGGGTYLSLLWGKFVLVLKKLERVVPFF
jgi:hypothetical protein